MKTAKGFTLAEILVATAIGIVATGVAVSVFLSGLRARAEGDANLALEREGNMILERIVRGLYGTGGLREAGWTSISLHDSGKSISFTVDRNATPTETTADDTTSMIFLDDKEVYYRPDTSLASSECISDLHGHVDSLQFTQSTNGVDISLKLSSPIPASDRNAFIHLSKSVTMRN